jgi:hypothetical protein
LIIATSRELRKSLVKIYNATTERIGRSKELIEETDETVAKWRRLASPPTDKAGTPNPDSGLD